MHKGFLTTTIGATLLAASISASAVTLVGSGCNTSGTPTYTYVNEGTSLVLVNGAACFISNLSAGETAALSSVVSEAQVSGRSVTIGTGASLGGGSPNGLSVVLR